MIRWTHPTISGGFPFSVGTDCSLFARLASNAWIGARQANTIDEKGVNMNNTAAKLAAEHYGKTLDEVEVSRIDFFMSLWAALDGADAA